MKRVNLAFLLVCAFLLVGGVSRSASAQNATNVDIQRLQDSLDDASRDVTDLKGRDSALASRLQTELDDLRDETIYLKVKLKKNESVPRTEYFEMRDRIDNVRSQARGTNRAASSPSPSPAPSNSTRSSSGSRMDIPVGTELDVRLQQSLSSATAVVEDRFEATTLVDLKEGDRVMIPAGSVMRGVVSSVTKTTRVERKGSLTVAFDQVRMNGRDYPIRGTVSQAIESEGIKGETTQDRRRRRRRHDHRRHSRRRERRARGHSDRWRWHDRRDGRERRRVGRRAPCCACASTPA